MLAIGPVAVLPAPLLAAVPITQPFAVQNGSANYSPSGTSIATITASDRAVLNWGTTASGTGTVTLFNIPVGDSFSFLLPAGGSVLNKVTAGTGTFTGTDGVAAIINGTLTSNGRVLVLANGAISIGDGAAISTTGGLVLSTLAEATDLTYIVSGDLAYTGASSGSITIGDGVGAVPSVVGNLNAWAGSVDVKGASLVGNVIINSVGAAGQLNLSGANPTTVTGNLSASTSNGVITQGAATVGVSGAAVLSSGTAAITLTNSNNNFGAVRVNSTNNVALADVNDIALGASSAGNLNVSAGGNITTTGAVATTTTATLASTGVGGISYATGSSAGTINASTNNGAISIDTVGNVSIGTVTAGGTLKSVVVTTGGNYTSAPTIAVANRVGGAAGPALTATTNSAGAISNVAIGTSATTYTSNPVVTISGGGIETLTPAIVTATLSATSVASVTVTGGGNYTVGSSPTVTISGGGGANAAGTAVLDANGKVIAISITNPGSGFTGTPTVTISGTLQGGQAAPILSANLVPTTIASLNVATATVTNGNGYLGTNPTITVSAQAPGGTAVVVPISTATSSALTTTTSGSLTSITLTTSGQPTFTATPAITVSKGGTESTTPASAVSVAGSAVSISSSGAVRTTGAVFGSSIAVTAPSVTNSGGTLSTGGTVSINATAGDALLPTISAGSASLVASGNVTQGAGALTTRAGSNLVITAANATLTASNVIPNNRLLVSGGNITVNNSEFSGLRVGPTVTSGDLILATGGNVVFGTGGGTLSEAITVGGNLTTTISGASISGVTYNNTANATSTAARYFTGDLSSVTATFPAPATGGVQATGRPTFDSTGRLTGVTMTNVGSGYTSAPSTVTISAGPRATLVTAGTAPTANVTRTPGSITDDDDVSFTVNGSLNLTTNGGNVVFDSQIGSGRGFGTFGQLNANALATGLSGNVSVVERTTIGVGNVTANVLTVNSTGGSIVFQPTNLPLAATYATSITTVSARANTANSSITQTTVLTLGGGNSTFNNSGGSGTVLDNATNSLGGNVTVFGGANNTLVTNSNFSLGTSTSVTGANRLTVTAADPLGLAARNITILNGGNATNVTLNASGTISVAGGTFANLTLSAANLASSANAISQATTFATVNNTLTVGATTGAVALGSNVSNTINNLVVNDAPGGITVGTTGSLTVRGTTTGAVSASAGVSNLAGNYGISLGNLTAGSVTLSAANGTGNITTDGVSGAIAQQTGTTLSIFGPISATTFGGNITLANANNNFGGITLNTGTPASGVITLVERDTAKIASLTSSNAATITSAFGSVIEDVATTLNVPALSVTANAGSILLGTAGVTSGSLTSATLNTGGAAAIRASGDLSLGASRGNSLTATAGGNLSQSGTLSVFGSSVFTAAGNVTLADSANNFGPVSATVTNVGSSISIAEGGTLNLRRVSMAAGSTGNFSATSVRGDIIDSGLGGVVLGGTTAANGFGVVTLAAANGNISLDDPTTEIATAGGVNFTGRDVTLAVLGGSGTTPIVLGSVGTTSSASGNLTVSSATGNIGNAGNVTVGGVATFQAGNGTINMTANGNRFGSLRFSSAAAGLGGATTVAITQTGDMNILTGSSAVGGVVLSSSGNLTITNSGGGVVALGSTALLAASGSITLPKLLQAAGTITLNAAGTKDLSALSLASDLGGRNPQNFGAGSYLPPSP